MRDGLAVLHAPGGRVVNPVYWSILAEEAARRAPRASSAFLMGMFAFPFAALAMMNFVEIDQGKKETSATTAKQDADIDQICLHGRQHSQG